MKKRIAIVGMGPAGISVLRAMSQYDAYQACQIVIYNNTQTFGTGMPYQKDSDLLLINQTADTMSIDPNNKLDFVNWVKEHKDSNQGPKSFLPRTWYGEYLKSKLDEAIEKMHPEIIYEDARAIRVQEDGRYQVETDQTSQSFDILHLCIGHLAYQDPYNLRGHKNYIHHPYPVQEKLSDFPEGSHIGIIGTGLTSIDLMRFLRNQPKHYDLSFISRSGGFSLYREPETDLTLHYLTLENLEKNRKNGFVPLEKMIEWFRLECQEHGVDFDRLVERFGTGTTPQLREQLETQTDLDIVQTIIGKMDPYIADYMTALKVSDRRLFYSEYESLFHHLRAPMPKQSAERLIEGVDNQEIFVYAGIQSIEPLEDGFTIQLANKSVTIDYLINATGHEMSLSEPEIQLPLIAQLVDEYILEAEYNGGAQVIWPSAEAVSQKYGILNNFYVHGQLVQGIQYGNSAHLLMQQATKVVALDYFKNF